MTPFSIMVVDDSDVDRYILARYLKGLNSTIEVFEFDNGRPAYQFLQDFTGQQLTLGPTLFPPLAIFLDINMPIMPGTEFLKAFSLLRNTQAAFKKTSIIMCSSSLHERDQHIIAEYDFVTGYLCKGNLDSDTLTQVLKDAVRD